MVGFIGVTSAFRAYQRYVSLKGADESLLPGLENFSRQQIFFISFATSFCSKYANNVEANNITLQHEDNTSSSFRIIKVLSHSKEFSEYFDCPVNSPMNHDTKHTFNY